MNDKQLSFEQAMKRLSEVVSELEKPELTLEASLDLYKEGVELSAVCKKYLDDAEMKIRVLDEKNTEKDYNPNEQ